MSFKTAIKFLTTYRIDRAKALNNEQVMKWSTSSLADIPALIAVFDSTSENNSWQKEYNVLKSGGAVSADRLQALRLGVNFLAGCRRDIVIQYAAAAVGRARLQLDYERYDYSRLAYANYIMDAADKVMDLRLKV